MDGLTHPMNTGHAQPAAAPAFNRDFDPRYADCVEIAPTIRRVVARNPSNFTFYGTGTYIIGGPAGAAVIDPGPPIRDHIDALLRALDGWVLEAILITHTHMDHSPAARPLQAATGAPTYGYGPHAGGAAGGAVGGAVGGPPGPGGPHPAINVHWQAPSHQPGRQDGCK